MSHYTYSMWSNRGDTLTVSTLSDVAAYDKHSTRVTVIAVDVLSDSQFVDALINTLIQDKHVFLTSLGIDCPVMTLRHLLYSFDEKIKAVDTSKIWRKNLISYNFGRTNAQMIHYIHSVL